MTDSKRLADPVEIAKYMPMGSAIIYRHFGKEDRVQEAEALRQVTFERGQQFLIGHDPELAIATGADGVHFRRDSPRSLSGLWRKRCPGWILTMAGFKTEAVFAQPIHDLDALIISSVFESQSPSAGDPIGLVKFTSLCQKLDVPVIALGGINAGNASKIETSGASGLAAVSAFERT